MENVKTKYRSLLTAKHRQSLMLTFVERDICTSVDSEKLIGMIAAKSEELKRLLVL